jgi:hypothetical protein
MAFELMIKEDEAIVEESASATPVKLSRPQLGRALSGLGALSRNRPREIGGRRQPRWREALAEIAKTPGQRLMPMMNLLLMEDFQAQRAKRKAEAPLTPVVPEAPDLLGFMEPSIEAKTPGMPEAPLQAGRSASRRSSSCLTAADNPFAVRCTCCLSLHGWATVLFCCMFLSHTGLLYLFISLI